MATLVSFSRFGKTVVSGAERCHFRVQKGVTSGCRKVSTHGREEALHGREEAPHGREEDPTVVHKGGPNSGA